VDTRTNRAAEAVGEGGEQAREGWSIAELTLGFATLTSRLVELLEKHRKQPVAPLVVGSRVDDSCQLKEISFDHSKALLDGASRLAVGLLMLDGRTAAWSRRRAPRSVAISQREFQGAVALRCGQSSRSPFSVQHAEH
jgi:hypothetical protein